MNKIEKLGDAAFVAIYRVFQEVVAEANRRLDGIHAEVADANLEF
jgi:hypothetical protein